MFKHALKIGLRNLLRNKVFTFINVIGLSIGMASSILILLLMQELLSVDQFHENKHRIYKVYNNIRENGQIHTFPGSPSLLTPYLQSNFKDAEAVVRTHSVSNFIFSTNNKHLEAAGLLTDPSFLTTFTFPLIKGNAQTALQQPHSVVLTESFAKRLFGNQAAIGNIVRVDSNANFMVTGIVKDPPTYTMIGFDYLIPYSYRKEVGWEILKWDDYSVDTYVLLKAGANLQSANAFFKTAIKKNAKEINNEPFLYPLPRVYLHGYFQNGKEAGGGIDFINRMGLIGIFILLIACINYVNLSTARSILRAREVGIRKVSGAGKFTLVGQFIAESVLVAAIAAIIGLGIAQLSLQFFSQLVYTPLHIPYFDPYFWLAGIIFILITGVLAGLYPALVLSAYRPVSVLKGVVNVARSAFSPRKVLVVFQFGFAIVFIICTIVVYQQIRLGQGKDIGYDVSNLAYIYLRGELPKHFNAASAELYESGAVTSVTRTNSPITQIWSSSDSYEWAGKNPNFKPNIVEFHSDNNFAKTFGLQIVAGRDLNALVYPIDTTGVLLNETAVKLMGFKNPIGQFITSADVQWHVVGVVKDFIAGYPYSPIDPMVIQGPKNWFGTLSLRLNPAHANAANLEKINKIIQRYNPDYPSNFIFVDDDYRMKFSGPQGVAHLAVLFAAMAILISCMGLYALAMYTANTRVREIGIRKVLGASVTNIALLLSKNFVGLVMVAFIIASPVAWWIVNAWLEGFAYRVAVSWWIFALTAIISAAIALLTISYQAIRAALTNPTKNLRNE